VVYKKAVRDRIKEPYRFTFPKYEPLTSSGDRIEWWRWDVDDDGVSIIKQERLWTRI